MKWMLVMLVFGQPVKTDLLYESLRACLAVEESVRKAYADAYTETQTWAEKNVPADQRDTVLKLALTHMTKGTCIPHAAL